MDWRALRWSGSRPVNDTPDIFKRKRYKQNNKQDRVFWPIDGNPKGKKSIKILNILVEDTVFLRSVFYTFNYTDFYIANVERYTVVNCLQTVDTQWLTILDIIYNSSYLLVIGQPITEFPRGFIPLTTLSSYTDHNIVYPLSLPIHMYTWMLPSPSHYDTFHNPNFCIGMWLRSLFPSRLDHLPHHCSFPYCFM